MAIHIHHIMMIYICDCLITNILSFYVDPFRQLASDVRTQMTKSYMHVSTLAIAISVINGAVQEQNFLVWLCYQLFKTESIGFKPLLFICERRPFLLAM